MASSRNNESADTLLEAVAACLRRHLQPHQTLVVAFSGGRDSVALLHALKALQAEFDFALSACHVNHGLSPHADNWEAFCRHTCDEAGIALEVQRVNVPRGSPEGLEAAARACRYQALTRAKADWLAFAHHRGDQAETVLFNLLRGAGLRGAAAMQEVRPLRAGLSLIRPLLKVSRHEIEATLQRQRLSWVDDESNSDTGFSRNFLRHEVLPLMTSRFSAAEERLATAAEHFAEARSLLDELALLDLGSEPARFPLPLSCLTRLSEPRGRNLLHFLLGRHGVRIPSQQRLTEALRQLREAKPDRHPAVVFGEHLLCRHRSNVYLEPVIPAGLD